jgi:hypothetical protein
MKNIAYTTIGYSRKDTPPQEISAIQKGRGEQWNDPIPLDLFFR